MPPGSRNRSSSILGQALALPSHTRGGSRMRESRTYGSGRGACDETRVPTATETRVHRPARRRGGVATRGGRAAGGDAGDRIPEWTIGAGVRSRSDLFPPWPERSRLRRGSERGDRISLGGGTTGSAAAARG